MLVGSVISIISMEVRPLDRKEKTIFVARATAPFESFRPRGVITAASTESLYVHYRRNHQIDSNRQTRALPRTGCASYFTNLVICFTRSLSNKTRGRQRRRQWGALLLGPGLLCCCFFLSLYIFSGWICSK